jgi:large subunit ribosomal protein L21
MFSRSALSGVFDLRCSSRLPASTSISSSIWNLTRRVCLHQGSTGSRPQFLETIHETLPKNASSSFSPSHPSQSLPSRPEEQSSIISADRTITSITTATTAIAITANNNGGGQAGSVPQTRSQISREKLPVKPSFTKPLALTKSLANMLPHLTMQTPHYISAHLHARPYLLTAGDHLRLPFLMSNVKPGDILRFNRASVIGSRDFTLKGTPYIDERMFECRVRVLGVDAEPLRIKEKTKRRQRHVRQVKSKHRYTLMRVMDVRVKALEELLQEGARVVEDGVGGIADSSTTVKKA